MLVDYLRKDYAATLAKVANLTAHGEVTYDTLFAVFVPGTVVVAACPVTGEPRAFELVSANKVSMTSTGVYELVCESVDADADAEPHAGGGAAPTFNPAAPAFNPAAPAFNPAAPPFIPPMPPSPGCPDPELARAGGRAFGRVQNRIFVPFFRGTVKIDSLEVYPVQYHATPSALEAKLVARGQKWLALRGVHHMQYEGPATYTMSSSGTKGVAKHNVSALASV